VYKCISAKDRFLCNRYIDYGFRYQDIQTMRNGKEGILDRQIWFWPGCEVHDISGLRIFMYKKNLGVQCCVGELPNS